MIQNFGLAIFEEDEFIAISQLSPTLNLLVLENQHDGIIRQIVELETDDECLEFFPDLAQVFNYFKTCQNYEMLKIFLSNMEEFFSLHIAPDETETLVHIQDYLKEEYYSDEEDYAKWVYARQLSLKVPMWHPVAYAIELENPRFFEVLMECPSLGMNLTVISTQPTVLRTHIFIFYRPECIM